MMKNFKEKLPPKWESIFLKELVSFNGVFSDGDWIESKDQDSNGNVRLIQLADIGEFKFLDKSNRFLTEKKALDLKCLHLLEGDILISRLGDPLGKACIFPAQDMKAVTAVDICVFRSGTEHVNSKLVLYFLNSPQVRHLINSQSSGTTRKRITGKKLKNLQFRIPPFNEQKRIVSKIEELFSDLDEAEKSLKNAQKLLKQYKQSILKSAITGELTKKWREKNKHRLESGEDVLKRIFKNRCEKYHKKNKHKKFLKPDITNLPALPNGWVWASINQLFEVYVGSTPSRKESSYWEGNIPWVSSGEVAFCRIKDTKEKITNKGYENSSVRLHPPGTVLLAMIGEGKTRGQAAILEIEACHNQNSASIRVSDTDIPPEYVFYFFMYNYEHSRRAGQGGNQPALNGEKVKSFIIPLPSIEEIKKIIEIIDDLFSKISTLSSNNEMELKWSYMLRQSILKKAFSGQLVSQNKNDEPAAELLERVRKENAEIQRKICQTKTVRIKREKIGDNA